MVYMGKFPDAEFMDRKRGELRLMNIDFDRAGGSSSRSVAGRFSTEEAAQRQLATFARQGVRTARVVQERPDVTTYALRLPKATPTLRNEVAALAGKNLVPKALQACPSNFRSCYRKKGLHLQAFCIGKPVATSATSSCF
jgi:hypothetical protein